MRQPDCFVSVVIPTARRPQLVVRAVRSVLEQTYGALEAIVVIDGAEPDTVRVLYEIQDPRLRVVSLGVCGGGAMARNHGVGLARGAWVAFLDDDDEWLPDKLAQQITRASPDQDVLVTCLSHVITPRGNYLWPRRIYDNREPISDYLFARRHLTLGEGHLQTSTLLLPRRLALRVPFRRAEPHEDWDLILRLFGEQQVRLETVRVPLVKYHTEDTRPSVGRGGSWRRSLDWLDGMRPLVTRRAYSGFCATVVAQRLALHGGGLDWLTVLRRAFRFGAPTPRQLLVFALILGVPPGLRLWARARLQRRPAA